jgi:hypothetical protein
VAQAVDCQLCKHEALKFKPQFHKKRKILSMTKAVEKRFKKT